MNEEGARVPQEVEELQADVADGEAQEQMIRYVDWLIAAQTPDSFSSNL